MTKQENLAKRVYGAEPWADTITAMHSGETIEVTEDVYWYFLEVLPPVHMGYRATLNDGTIQRACFGFAEGWEPVTAFWENPRGRFFCQRTKEMNPRC